MVATKKIAAVAGLAAAAVLGLANSASVASAQYTETSLNSSLAWNLSGLVVAAPPNAADGLAAEKRRDAEMRQTTGLKHVNGKLKNSAKVTDGKFPTFKVIASTDTFSPGTAREALHLWNEIRVA